MESTKAPQTANKPGKLPAIRQTKTSYYRMVKANPLLLLEKNRTISDIKDLGIPQSIINSYVSTKPSEFDQTSQNALSVSKLNKTTMPRNSLISKHANFNKSVQVAKVSSTKLTLPKTTNSVQTNSKIIKTEPTKSIKILPNSTIKQKLNTKPTTAKSVAENRRNTLSVRKFNSTRKLDFNSQSNKHISKTEIRRSVSAQELKPKKTINNPKPTKTQTTTKKPIITSSASETDVFKTPSAYIRRSVAIPSPVTTVKHVNPFISENYDLQKQLHKWLKEHGKSVGSYHHLKCFGLHNTNVKQSENKENVEPDISTIRNESYENLHIPSNENDLSETPKVDLDVVASDALNDLYKLILDGFPKNQCEAWLDLIRQKYTYLEDEPQYWECRAAIEQSRGNITSAVECYRKAIIKGAQVENVDNSLDQLLQKFSLLNIDTCIENGSKKEQIRIENDARNAFKTSIIQFAIQERTIKKKEIEASGKKFVATPVRRSTRLSRCAYTSTPGIQLYSSLNELEPSFRKSINFRKNESLVRFCE